jgi:hypothetical protein
MVVAVAAVAAAAARCVVVGAKGGCERPCQANDRECSQVRVDCWHHLMQLPGIQLALSAIVCLCGTQAVCSAHPTQHTCGRQSEKNAGSCCRTASVLGVCRVFTLVGCGTCGSVRGPCSGVCSVATGRGICTHTLTHPFLLPDFFFFPDDFFFPMPASSSADSPRELTSSSLVNRGTAEHNEAQELDVRVSPCRV